LALIHLNPSSGWPTDLYLRASLLRAKKAMESFTNRRFYFYNQVEDQSYIYIIGSWPSLSQHTNEWIPSKENREMLELLKDRLDVDWMFHLDIDQDKDDSVSSEMIPFSGPTLAIARHFVDPTNKTKHPAISDPECHPISCRPDVSPQFRTVQMCHPILYTQVCH
ncbi:hypothetical protein V1504DRAFT_398923, partial [Lipomyces starkeyi]